MNKLIEQLAKQASATRKHVPAVWQFYDNELVKFAELIVQECCNGLGLEDAIEVMEKFGIKQVPEMVPHDEFGELMTASEFDSDVEYKVFTPDDGSGYWATSTEMSKLSVWSFDKPVWATHVMWYNK
jgi:hypothetical protein